MAMSLTRCWVLPAPTWPTVSDGFLQAQACRYHRPRDRRYDHLSQQLHRFPVHENGYFDKPYAELKAGESLELTFYRGNGDGVGKPCTGAAVSIDGAEAGTTDDNAKITLKFDKAGSYVVTGAGDSGTAVATLSSGNRM